MDSITLGIIGCGAIGSDVAMAADDMEEIGKIYLYDVETEKAEKLSRKLEKGIAGNFISLLKSADIIFEAASQEAVRQYAEKIIDEEKDLIIMSIGSLLDESLLKRLRIRNWE